jgi:hypothetical protein
VLPAVVPTAASADYASANQWGGGALAPARQAGASRYPTRGTLVSMTTSATAARLRVDFQTPRCGTAETLRGRVTPAPGGNAEYLAIAVDAARKVRNRREHLDYAVSLRPAAPGVLSGTASVRGTFRNGRRTIRCNATSPVTLRSRSAVTTPLQTSPTDPALPRTGILASTVQPRVLASIAITKRTDGWHHAMWTEHISCVSGGTRSSFETVDLVPRFRVRTDGTFRGREVVRERGRTKDGPYRYTFVGTIRGRIGADGIARGTATSRSRYRQKGFYDKVCSLGRTTFAAAP